MCLEAEENEIICCSLFVFTTTEAVNIYCKKNISVKNIVNKELNRQVHNALIYS